MMNNNREAKHPVQEIADAVGGTIKEMGRLPDGSGFAVMSMPLPKDHWLTAEGYNTPPMPFRTGSGEHATVVTFPNDGWPHRGVRMTRQEFADRIRMVGKYACRASTMNGKDMDFDPDAMLQNLVTGFLGYWTANGLSDEAWANPQERTQWCCDGDGKGGHHKKCRFSKDDYATSEAPQQS